MYLDGCSLYEDEYMYIARRNLKLGNVGTDPDIVKPW